MELTQTAYQREGPIARIALDRPRYRNAQSRVLLEELDSAFARAAEDDEVRVIVLAGAGDHFSSGHDLGTPEEEADRRTRPLPTDAYGKFERSWDVAVATALRWRDLPKPTIAAVQGWCIYGGWLIASAMDLIVAADDARFVPGLVQYFSAPWDLGVRKTKELLFQSRVVTAAEAHDLGFVNVVVPRPGLETETAALAHRIAETDPFVTRMAKHAVNLTQDVMGFRAAISACHSDFALAHMTGALGGDDVRTTRRLPGVDQAIRKRA